MTVDEAHTVGEQGMGREGLHVAMFHGWEINRVPVVTDEPDDECVPGAATPTAAYGDVLDGILATFHGEPAATETWETYHPSPPWPLAVPPLHAPHDYGRSARSRLTSYRLSVAAPAPDLPTRSL